MQKQKGFTIVELLIVIVVIGILAALVMSSFTNAQEKAKVSSAQNDLVILRKAIITAREVSGGKTLMQVTGSNCTYCFDQARYELTLDNLGAAAGTNLSALKKGNPWGAKYYIDENEGEQSLNPCVKDAIGAGTPGKGIANNDMPFILPQC